MISTAQYPVCNSNEGMVMDDGPTANESFEVVINKDFWEKRALSLTPILLIGLSDPDNSISQSIIPLLENVRLEASSRDATYFH